MIAGSRELLWHMASVRCVCGESKQKYSDVGEVRC
jgi:hypothetical protein